MAIGGLWDKIRGNPLEKAKIMDLRAEELRLKTHCDRIRKGIDDTEKDKKKKFREGVGADLFKKKMLIQDMQGLDMEAKLKYKSFSTASRQLRFIKNLLIVKSYEKQLKDKGVWKKLTNIPQEKLETYLIKVSLDGKVFDEVVDELNKPFEMDIAEIEGAVTDDEKKILKSWEQVEAGTMEPEKAESELSIDKTLMKEEEKDS